MENEKKMADHFLWISFGICLLLLIFAIIGFVLFANREDEVIEEVENGGNIILNYTNNITGLKLTNVVPTTDAIGIKNLKEGEFFDFSIDVSLDNATSVEYEICATKDKSFSTISDDDIRIYLEKEESGTYTMVFGPDKYTPLKKDSDLGSKAGSMILTSVKSKKARTDNYRLRMWLSDTSLLASGNYSVEIKVNGKAN